MRCVSRLFINTQSQIRRTEPYGRVRVSLKIVRGKTIDLAVMIVKRYFHGEIRKVIDAGPFGVFHTCGFQIAHSVLRGIHWFFGKELGQSIESFAFAGGFSVTKPEIRADQAIGHSYVK